MFKKSTNIFLGFILGICVVVSYNLGDGSKVAQKYEQTAGK